MDLGQPEEYKKVYQIQNKSLEIYNLQKVPLEEMNFQRNFLNHYNNQSISLLVFKIRKITKQLFFDRHFFIRTNFISDFRKE